MEKKEKELKLLRQQIVTLNKKQSEKNYNENQLKRFFSPLTEKSSNLEDQNSENIKAIISSELITVKKTFHPLAKQTLELREFLKLPLPTIKESNDFVKVVFTEENANSGKAQSKLPLDFFRDKEKEIQSLRDILEKIQKQGLNLENLESLVKDFNIKNSKARLLVLNLPLEDRKMLSDLSDFVLSQLNLSILILFGSDQINKYPVFVNLSKKFSSILSAGSILKNDIAPLMKGRGGGKAHFAQGSVADKTKVKELDKLLIKKWS